MVTNIASNQYYSILIHFFVVLEKYLSAGNALKKLKSGINASDITDSDMPLPKRRTKKRGIPMPAIPEHTTNKVIVVQNEEPFVEGNNLEVHNGEERAADTVKPIATVAADQVIPRPGSSQRNEQEQNEETTEGVVSQASISIEDATNKDVLAIPSGSARPIVIVEDSESIPLQEKGMYFIFNILDTIVDINISGY